MHFYVSAALQAGFVGTLAMSLLMSMARAMGMTRMPMVHPAMRPATAGGEGLHIDAPGVLGKNWGPTTPLGVIVGHAVYGLVVGAVYGVLVAHL